MAVSSIQVSPQLREIIARAGDRNGIDFDYLLNTAMRESSLNPAARAQTSSAVGLFQFIESTWLEVMKAEGPRLGYEDYANAIEETGDGDFVIRDPALRREVLALREDPAIASDLAAAFTKRNGDYLFERFGRMPSAGELYIAHFMGARGAARMFEAGLDNPDQVAAAMFPRQAAANPSIFYDNGQPRTIREVYRALVTRHEAPAVAAPFAAQQMTQTALDAVNAAAPIPAGPQPVLDPATLSFVSLFATGAQGPAAPAPLPTPPTAASGSLFTSFYRE